jgi:hypothetical protein
MKMYDPVAANGTFVPALERGPQSRRLATDLTASGFHVLLAQPFAPELPTLF